MLRFRKLRVLVLGVLVIPFASVIAEEISQSAHETYVRDLGDSIFGVLNTSHLSISKRASEIQEILATELNFEFISKFVLGRHWRDTDPAQRSDFREAYSRYVTKSYANKLTNYNGEVFSVIRSRTVSDREALVETKIRGADGNIVRMVIRVHAQSERLSVTDVAIEGVSFVLINRAEFDKFITKNGFAALLEKIKSRNP